jgi:hypothetical protein
MSMKAHYGLSAFVLADSMGEWWESVKTDGSTRMWSGQTLLTGKQFKTAEQALAFARARGFKRYKVEHFTPPVRPSRTWGTLTLPTSDYWPLLINL